MDDQRFDQLSRRLARLGTRRQALKTIAGAVVASVAGVKGTVAQGCTTHYSPCQGDDQCCTGAVCENGLCMPGCRIEDTFINAWISPPDTICQACTPEVSTTGWSPANEGMSCWFGNSTAEVTTCQAGSCAPVTPQNCPPPTACHLNGSVDPVTGMCANPPAPAGTPCGNGPMCFGDFYQPADLCDGNGFCIGGGARTMPCAPYMCGVGECTTGCETDNDCASGAHCDDGQCVTDQSLGEPCDEFGDCQSGICVEGICCNQRCEGLCETCSAETGGHCRPIICDDGIACTTGTCDEDTGQCVHTINNGTCFIDGTCYTASAIDPVNACQHCDPASSKTQWSFAPAGTVCADTGNCNDGTITRDALCNATGVCEPGTVFSCLPYACTEQLTCRATCSMNAECAGGATCCRGACITGECCTPQTCATNGGACGEDLDDGCGGTIDCPCDSSCPPFQTRNTSGQCVSPCSLGTCGACGLSLCGAQADGTAVCINGNPLVTCSQTCTTTPSGADACLQVWDVPNLSPWCGTTTGAKIDFLGGFSLPVCYSEPD